VAHGTHVPRLARLAFALAAVTALSALTAGAAAGSAFPGENGRIVFQSTRDGRAEIYSMNADGTDETRLTNTPGGNSEPSFSPDGRTIVFRSNRDGNAEIYTMNADGTGERRITNNPAPDTKPSFSPGGQGIVFLRAVERYPSIWVMDVDGSNERRLTNSPPFGEGEPTFSPTGGRIAFAGGTSAFLSDIFIMDTDGANRTDLLAPLPPNHVLRNSVNRDPSFSPDGQTLAFASAFENSGQSAIYTMNVPFFVNPTRLVFNASQPAFSPDGTKIVFRGESQVAVEIHVMNRDGSDERALTTRSAGTSDALPNWGPRPRPTARADVIVGDGTVDVICGHGGADVIRGLGGNDTLYGDRCGRQPAAAGPRGAAAVANVHDRLFGGRGNDRLFGGAGADRLHGGPGRDVLRSGSGDDTALVRDGARDQVICGKGQDVVRADRRDRLSGCERVRIG
jgi:Tol biopolymer transport system component